MRPLIIVFLLTLLSSCQSRILTIEEFGGEACVYLSIYIFNNPHPIKTNNDPYCCTKGKSDAAMNVEKEAVPHPEFLHSSRQNSPLYTHKIHNNHRYLARSHHRSKYHNEELIQQAINNTRAYNLALKAAKPGDTVLLHENDSYSFIGGIEGVGLQDITLDFAGYTRFIYDTDRWPMRKWTGGKEDGITEEYVPAIDMLDCRGIVITCSATNKAIVSVDYEKNEIYLDEDSGIGGIIDGHGKKWWDDAIMGDIHVDSRPRLIDIRGSMDVTLEHLTLVNSPYWTLTLEAIGAEVHHVNILVDRNYQRNIVNNTYFNDEHLVRDYSNSDTAIEVGRRNLRDARKLPQLKFHFPEIPDWILQPQDLNTDGIDPIGRDIYIHDCIVLNDDDSIAVKPPRNGRKGSVMNGTIPYECTGNITIEDMVLTGFGASIGSVGPMESHPCVDNVSFKNIRMPGTGKGIYIKSNKSDCHGKVSSSITNIK